MQAAILGAGVIGCGWVSRFLLHGWDVVVYDPAEDVGSRVAESVAAARSALNELYDGKLPSEGGLSFAQTPAAAVATADWVQESLPEDLALKRALYEQIAAQLPEHALLASSTSGFKPSDLAQGLSCASLFVVCHPFNPVYLLPAVEVVGASETDTNTLSKAQQILTSVGMQPIVLHAEIDAHVADRLMEALWREALWLVRDGVATTQQIDDVMRYGFGLRWAQMGLFETYRLGGGKAGMRHFLAQFGPALSWPWSRLTDVPDMDEALVDKIASQSEAQSGHLSIEALTQLRDVNLVAILRALRATNSGAGALINTFLSADPD